MRIRELLFEAGMFRILNHILLNKPLPANPQQRKEIENLVNKIILRIQNYPDSFERFTIERIPFDDIEFDDRLKTAREVIQYIFNRMPEISPFYKDWIFRSWLSRDIEHLHDAVEFQYDVQVFDANKGSIPQDKRDINQLKPSEVREIVRKFDMSPQDKDDEQFEEDWIQAQKESEILYKDLSGEFILYTPKTKFAASVLGYDTDWCTAYGYKYGKWPQRTHNHFEEYNNEGRLYIFDFPRRGIKYQIHLGGENKEYKNKENQDLTSSEKKLLKNAITKLPINIILEFLEQYIDLDLIPDLEDKIKKPSNLLKKIKNPNTTIYFLAKYPAAIEVLLNFAIQIVEPLAPIWKELLTRQTSRLADHAEKMLEAIKNEDVGEMNKLRSEIQNYNSVATAAAYFSDESTREKALPMWRAKRVGESLISLSYLAKEVYSRRNSSQDTKVFAQSIADTIRALTHTVSGAYNTKDFKMPLSDKMKSDFQSVLIDLLEKAGL